MAALLSQKQDMYAVQNAVQQEQAQRQNKENIYQKVCQQLVNQLNLQLDLNDFKELNKISEKGLSVPNFAEKLKELTDQQKRSAREAVIQL